MITMKEAENELEFKAVEVFASRLKVNARMVEAALQMRFQFLKLGVRLWRGRAAFVERLKAATAGTVEICPQWPSFAPFIAQDLTVAPSLTSQEMRRRCTRSLSPTPSKSWEW